MTKQFERRIGKQQDPTLFDELLPQLYVQRRWKKHWPLFRLVQDWPDIVGKEIAALSYPAFFRKDVLWIFIHDSVWMHHLNLLKPELLDRINHAVAGKEKVCDIRWKIAEIRTQDSLPSRKPPRPIDPIMQEQFYRLSERISDSQCRAALQRLWNCFAEHSLVAQNHEDMVCKNNSTKVR